MQENNNPKKLVVSINLRKTCVLLLLYFLTVWAVVTFHLSRAKFYKEQGISSYAKADDPSTTKSGKHSNTSQTFYYGEHFNTFSVDMPGDLNAVPSENIVPILINPNLPDNFIVGSKSTPLQELALLHRLQDKVVILIQSLLFFILVWSLFHLFCWKFSIRFLNDSRIIPIKIGIAITVGMLFFVGLMSLCFVSRINDNSQCQSVAASQVVGQYKVYQISKDSVVLMCDTINAPLVPFRADEVKIYTQKYNKRPIDVFPIDSTVYYIAMRVMNSIAITVQATDHTENIIQNASIQFTSDSLPVPTFNTDEQYVYFRTPDTFRIFKNGKITIDTVRQFIVNQPNTFKDTLLLLQAGIENNKTMAVFMNNGKFERPSLRLEKSHLYDGENIWENTFYKTPAKYVVIYSITPNKLSIYSQFGQIYSAFYVK